MKHTNTKSPRLCITTDVRTVVKLAKRAKKHGVTLDKYVLDILLRNGKVNGSL